MHFRYKGPRGKEIRLDDPTWLAQAIRDGTVLPDTPLAVGDEPEFNRAEEVTAYQRALVGLDRNRLGTAPPAAAGRSSVAPKPSKARVAILGLAATGALVLLLSMMRSGDASGTRATRVDQPGPGMEAALRRLVTEFGDSVALRQGRLERWVAQQRFEQRLKGSGLLAASSLRSLRAAAAEYQGRVDSLLAGTRLLAARLALRGDSLEVLDGALNGLFAGAENAFRDWERDLATYVGVQRATAVTLDSLVDFTLQRQQSFVVREGHPVFLSRTDAARFRELLTQLDELAGKEQRWPDEIMRKDPQWMTALAPADRPAFRRPPSAQRSNQ